MPRSPTRLGQARRVMPPPGCPVPVLLFRAQVLGWSSVYNGLHAPARVLDGDVRTWWASKSGSNAYQLLAFGLGAEYALSYVVFSYPPCKSIYTDFPMTIRIETRAHPNKGEWEVIGMCTTSLPSRVNGYRHACKLATGASGRYIRAFFVNNHGHR